MNERTGRAGLVDLAGFAVLACLFFGPILFTNAILTGYDTFTIFYPHRAEAARALLSGQLPLWNTGHFLGAPLLANPQVAVFYPFNWPFLLLAPGLSLAATMAFHFVLAGFFMCLFCRSAIGMSRSGAWLAGVAFAFGGFMGQQTGHLNQVSVATWLPLVLLLGKNAWTRRSPASIAACALAIGLQFLAGHTQESYMILVALGLYVIFLAIEQYGVRRMLSGLRGFVAIAGAVALGGALAAVQILPTLELSGLSIRSGGLSFRQASSFSLNPLDLLLALLPNYAAAPPNEMAGYIGVAALVLALTALRWSAKRRLVTFLAILAGLALLLALGRYTPVYWAAYYGLPGVGLFRVPARWLLLYSFAAAALAGMGLDALLSVARSLDPRPLLRPILAVATVIALAVAVGARWLHIPPPTVMLTWAVIVLVVAALIYVRLPACRPLLFSGIVIVLCVGELYAAGRHLEYNRYSAPESLTALRPAAAYLQTQTTAENPFRILSVSDATWDPGDLGDITAELPGVAASRVADYVDAVKNKELLTANLPQLFGLQSADGYDGGVLPLRRYVDLEGLFLPAAELSPDGRLRDHLRTIPDARLLGLLNVAYAITDKNRDVWINDVYYDLAFATPVSATLELPVARATIANAIGLVSRVEGLSAVPDGALLAQITVSDASGRSIVADVRAGKQTGSDGQPSGLRTVSTPGGNYYHAVITLPGTIVPARVSIRYLANEGALALRGISLIDQRTGASVALVASPDFELVHNGDVKIYRNLRAQPRAYAVHQVQVVVADSGAVALMRSAAFDPAHEVVLEKAVQGIGQESDQDEVRITRYEAARVDVRARLASPGLIVLSDAFYPGWQARIDGVPVPILRANVFFRAVQAPAGDHRVEFTYQPASLVVGAIVSAAALAVLAVCALWRPRGGDRSLM